MSSYVPASLRRLVSDRAEGLCEYCLMQESDTFLGCEVEHVVSEKHHGLTIESNLALACFFCNRFKGTDIAALVPGTNRLVRLYHPRTDRWGEHFRLDGETIIPISETGEATAAILRLNNPDRLLERKALIEAHRYPSEAAIRRMQAV